MVLIDARRPSAPRLAVRGWRIVRQAGTTAFHVTERLADVADVAWGKVGGDLASMSVRTTDSASGDGTAMLYVALGLLAVMLLCVAVACIPMLRKSPRDLSEIR